MEFNGLKGHWFYIWGTRLVGKSVKGCKAQEMTGPQRQILEGSEGRRVGSGILRLPKRTILSSASRVSFVTSMALIP